MENFSRDLKESILTFRESFPFKYDSLQWSRSGQEFWQWDKSYQYQILKSYSTGRVAEVSISFLLDPDIFSGMGILGQHGFQMIASYLRRVTQLGAKT